MAPAARAIDLDGGGISDVWEAYYGTGPLQANGNPDGDPMTNLQEYYFNTNPLVSNPFPIQFVTNLVTQEAEFSFYAPPVLRYRWQRTDDLMTSWTDLGDEIVGDDTVHIYTESISGIQKAFFRVHPLGAPDADGDLLDAFEESLLGTSDLTASSDTDTMPDGYEWANGLNPLINDANGDRDGDGTSNFQDARPNNAAAGILTIAIATPAHNTLVP